MVVNGDSLTLGGRLRDSIFKERMLVTLEV
jgi:hypothetical protein